MTFLVNQGLHQGCESSFGHKQVLNRLTAGCRPGSRGNIECSGETKAIRYFPLDDPLNLTYEAAPRERYLISYLGQKPADQ